ncbi:hypothetical protein PLESTB_001413900 [Pleodorina starrii]|uniref:Uncharacterized protein n=1 Tax=Pleodorina starrii TaxID=330485 RepID=A0A9W6F775_9CHLO|nr:hypothetical protein PLESTB_001413900 [Pleodorina starrii]
MEAASKRGASVLTTPPSMVKPASKVPNLADGNNVTLIARFQGLEQDVPDNMEHSPDRSTACDLTTARKEIEDIRKKFQDMMGILDIRASQHAALEKAVSSLSEGLLTAVEKLDSVGSKLDSQATTMHVIQHQQHQDREILQSAVTKLGALQQQVEALTKGLAAQQDAAQAAAPARVARAKEARAPAAQAAATPLVESDSLILSGVSGSYNTKLVQDSVDALMSGYIRAEGVTAVVEEIPSRGQKLDEFRQALKIPVAGAQGAASSTTGGDAEMADRTAGGADSPTRRVIVRFAGKEADVEVARSAFIGYAAFLREALRWVVGDNLTPAGRTARRAVFRDFKTLEAGGMRPRWRNGAQISVMPPGERVPRLCTAEDVRRCAGEQEGARNVNPDQ